MMRFFVRVTPIAGALIFPVIVPITISRVGLAAGVSTALILAIIWFVAMLYSAEMPH